MEKGDAVKLLRWHRRPGSGKGERCQGDLESILPLPFITIHCPLQEDRRVKRVLFIRNLIS
jgi:hypothetical protein